MNDRFHLAASTTARTATLRVAEELRLMRDRLHSLEDGLSDICSSGDKALAGNAVAALQQVDILVQSSVALATFMDAVAEDMPEDRTFSAIEALTKMPLRDMALRLSGTSQPHAQGGSPELF